MVFASRTNQFVISAIAEIENLRAENEQLKKQLDNQAALLNVSQRELKMATGHLENYSIYIEKMVSVIKRLEIQKCSQWYLLDDALPPREKTVGVLTDSNRRYTAWLDANGDFKSSDAGLGLSTAKAWCYLPDSKAIADPLPTLKSDINQGGDTTFSLA